MATQTTETSVLDDANEDFVIDAPGCVIRVKAAKNVTVIACGDLNCNGAKIGVDLNCYGATIDGTLDCYGATIDGTLDCYGATIGEYFYCSGAKIGVDLSCYGATIGGIKITNPTEEELILIREIYAIISDEPCRLNMKQWHCGTAHCLAGWCQFLREPDTNALDAGMKHLPSLSHLFFSTDEIVMKKLIELCE